MPEFFRILRENKERILGRGYFAKSSKRWFELWNQRKIENFESEKVVTPELADHSRFSVAWQGTYYGDTVCGIIPKSSSGRSAHSLVTILNSSVVQWYYKKATVPKANGFFIYKVMYLKRVPVPILSDAQEQLLRMLGLLITNVRMNATEAASPSAVFLEDLIDACVLECYFREHMTNRNLLFIDDIVPLLDGYDPNASDAKRREFLDHLHRTLNANESKFRDRLNRICTDSPELLAVIKEEGKV